MLDAFLRAARASREKKFTWHRVGQYSSRLLHEASPRAAVLVFPFIRWDWLADRGDLVQRWAAAVSAVPYTEEVGYSVVDVLLQIASQTALLPHIPVDVWSWLTKRPPLPPICLGRYVGTCTSVVKAVRALNDIEVLKSYFLHVWSEWNRFLSDSLYKMWNRSSSDSFYEMWISIQEDFGGVEMGHHRADLVERLDYVLGQLDRGLEYLKQHNPEFDGGDLWRMKYRYQRLRQTLLEADARTISGTSDTLILRSCPSVCTYFYPGCT
jgi:hypothetical protein